MKFLAMMALIFVNTLTLRAAEGLPEHVTCNAHRKDVFATDIGYSVNPAKLGWDSLGATYEFTRSQLGEDTVYLLAIDNRPVTDIVYRIEKTASELKLYNRSVFLQSMKQFWVFTPDKSQPYMLQEQRCGTYPGSDGCESILLDEFICSVEYE